VSTHQEFMSWRWPHTGQQKGWVSLSLDPKDGLTLAIQNDGNHAEITAIPYEVADALAGYMQRLTPKVRASQVGGWVGESVRHCDCGCEFGLECDYA